MYGHTPRGFQAVRHGLAFRRRIRRAHLTPGALYLDTLMRDAADARLPLEALSIRLLVASDVAEQIDRGPARV